MVSVVYEYNPIYILLTLRNAGILPAQMSTNFHSVFNFEFGNSSLIVVLTVNECKIKMETGKTEHLQNKQLKK